MFYWNMAKTQNVLYVTYDGLTDPLGQSQIIPYLKELAAKGYGIHILSCEKEERYSEQKEQVSELLKKHTIFWHPIKYTRKPPVFSTIVDIIYLKKNAKKLNKEYKFDLVHCRSYIAAFVGLYLKRNNDVNFIFDMRGFWADERVDGKIWNLKNPVYYSVYKYFKKKEKTFLNNSDYVVTLTEKAKTEICGKFKIPEMKIEVIPCCADTDFFSCEHISPTVQAQLKKQFGFDENDLIISYSGSVGTWYMLDEMLDFFKQLCLVYKNAKFFFITPDQPAHILNKANEKGIDTGKIIITKATRDQMPVMLSLSNIALFFIKPVYSKMASSPTKMGELLSLGIPFIANSGVGDIDDFMAENNVGLLVKDFTKAEYNKVVVNLPRLMALRKENIRQAAITNYSLNRGVESYLSIYGQLTKKIQTKE